MPTPDKPNPNRRPQPVTTQTQGTPASPTSASSWKAKTVGGTLFTVPSGNTAILRTPGMQAFLKQGIIPNALMPIIQEAMSRGRAPKQEDMSKMAENPQKLQEWIDLMDAVTVHCCVDPKVDPTPLDEEGGVIPYGDPRRDENVLYVDEVDFEDKMFIFNVAVGGTSDLTKFREELESGMAALSEREDVGTETVNVGGNL